MSHTPEYPGPRSAYSSGVSDCGIAESSHSRLGTQALLFPGCYCSPHVAYSPVLLPPLFVPVGGIRKTRFAHCAAPLAGQRLRLHSHNDNATVLSSLALKVPLRAQSNARIYLQS